MIFYIEPDQAGNIVHVARDPEATMVPLVNRVSFNDSNGNPLKSPDGLDLSPYGNEMAEPVEIDETTYDSLVADGPHTYTFDFVAQVVTKKAVTDGD